MMNYNLEIYEKISMYLEEEGLITPGERMMFMELIIDRVCL